MWICNKCKEKSEEQFDSCWNCGEIKPLENKNTKSEVELKIGTLSDDDLMEMLENKMDYTEEALQVAEKVMSERGHTELINKLAKNQIVKAKEIANETMLEIVKKRQVKKEIGGWKGFLSRTEWDFIQYPGVWYSGGVESIDKKFQLSEKPPRTINFATYKTEKGLAFQLWMVPSDEGYIYFRDDQIKQIKIVNTELFKKSMGALGQGLVGGLLFGGVGLLLGAAKGMSESTSGGVEQTTWMMTIKYEGNPDSNGVAIEISPKRKEQFVNFLKHHYRDVTEFDTEFDKEGGDSSEQTVPIVDKTEEIRKYAKLLDDGLITQEDYDAKKKELLGL